VPYEPAKAMTPENGLSAQAGPAGAGNGTANLQFGRTAAL